MCGRFTLKASGHALADFFQFDNVPEVTSRFNIAPTQPVAAVRLRAPEGKREFTWLRWGLVPSWSKDLKIGARTINARAETAAEKPAFRSALRRRRCLLPADGFYEWQQRDGVKQPYHFQLRDGGLFAFAGLWETWEGPGGELIETAALLTTEANELVRPIHERMPVILEPGSYGQWLEPAEQQPATLLPLLKPYRSDAMTAVPVSRWVNDAKHDDPKCLEPV